VNNTGIFPLACFNAIKESDKSNIRLEDINLGYSSIVVRQIQPIAESHII
jgi:hypothetical protein